ncbi:hypothetical protein ACFFF7_05960, partial [Novosphingobium aquiterrae]
MATPINVINFDTTLGNPADPLADDYNASDAGWYTAAFLNMPFYLKHYSVDESQFIGATGTGLFNPFLNMNGDSTLRGFNTDIDYANKDISDAGLDISNPNTDSLRLGDIPIVYRDLDGDGTAEAYYQINLDINENTNSQVSLEQLQIYTSHAYATLPDYHFDANNPDTSLAFANNAADAATDFVLRFNMRATGTYLILRDDGAGQGKLDYAFYFPVAMFAGAAPTDFVTLFSQFGPTPPDDAGFAEWNTINAAKITGIKFNDHDNDGVRDNGDEGLGGFTVYIDQNANNKLDSGEQYTLTAPDGSFTFYSLLPNSSYTVREVLSSADRGTGWTDGAWTALLPPNAGTWSQSTDPLNDGDQTVVVGAPGIYTVLVGNHALTPHIAIDKVFVNVTDGPDVLGGTTVINGVGDIANYTIAVTNDGEVALNNVNVTDTLADAGAVAVIVGGFNQGDLDHDGILDVGETWYYTATQTATQGDLDTRGGGDNDKDNSATVTATPIGSATPVTATDAAAAPIVANASIAITKVFNSWSGGDGDSLGDHAGDIANYTIVVTNNGNVTLTNVRVTDPLTGNTYVVGTLAPGASSAPIAEAYTLTQADLDSNGTVEANNFQSGSIENTATATSNQTGPASASAVAPITLDPAFTIDKTIDSIVDGADWGATGQIDSAGDRINYRIVITNTGNQTLTLQSIVDQLEAQGIPVGASDFLESIADNNKLDVGETWTWTWTEEVNQTELDAICATDEQITNSVSATFVSSTGTVITHSDSITTDVACTPALNILKDVTSITGGVGAGGLGGADSAGDKINYAITVQNTGNISLTGIT